MIRIVLILSLFFLPLLSNAQFDSMTYDGMNRTFLVHKPTGYTGSEDLPLVVAMHGGFGSATNLQNQSQLSVKADASNFIVVYPEGVKSPANITSWNAGSCCGYAEANNIDDVGFIDSLLDHMVANFAIDTDRIYATGMSNGGMLAYRLACEIPERIAAIAPVATTMVAEMCTPSKAVPIIHFHSYEDGSVPYNGGVGDGVSKHYNPPHDSVFNAWSGHNSCQSNNYTIIHNDDYTLVTWTDCECLYEIQYYITTDGGHSWHGGKKTLIGDTVSVHVNASDKMWEFFQIHSLECRTIGVNEVASVNISVYPNPNNGRFTMDVSDGIHIEQVELYNTYGQQVFLGNSKYIDASIGAGVYILYLTTNHGVLHAKVQIN